MSLVPRSGSVAQTAYFQLKLRKNLQFRSRIAAMSLFGMMNCLHTWYNPQVDGMPALLAKEVTQIFLRGVYAPKGTRLH
jgi:hypothetical protein